MNIFAIVALCLSILTFIIDLLMVALPWWVQVSDSVHFGLWEYCVSLNNDAHVCRLFSSAGIDEEGWLDACAALELTGLVCCTVAMVCAFLIVTISQNKGMVYIVGGIFEMISALFVLVGIIVFMCEYANLEMLHASFYLSIFGLIFAVVTGIFFFLAKNVMYYK